MKREQDGRCVRCVPEEMKHCKDGDSAEELLVLSIEPLERFQRVYPDVAVVQGGVAKSKAFMRSTQRDGQLTFSRVCNR